MILNEYIEVHPVYILRIYVRSRISVSEGEQKRAEWTIGVVNRDYGERFGDVIDFRNL